MRHNEHEVLKKRFILAGEVLVCLGLGLLGKVDVEAP